MATGEPRPVRFSGTERAAHWLHASAFAALLATGACLYFPALAGTFGSRETLKGIHLGVAAAWLVGSVLVLALGDRPRLAATARELEWFDRDDRRWLRRERPAPQGRFNAGQKAHAVVQAAAATLFTVSGTLLYLGERDTDLRFGGTIVLHDTLTLATTVLVLGHLYLALVHPPTRPALGGMVGERVVATWAREHHAKWAPGAQAAASLAPAWRRPLTWVLLGGAAVLAGFLAGVLLGP